MLEAQLQEVEVRQADRIRRGIKEFSADHSEEAARVGRALAQVIKEARSLEKDARRRAERLSPAEKRSVFVQWFESQMAEHQRELLQELTRLYNEQRINPEVR